MLIVALGALLGSSWVQLQPQLPDATPLLLACLAGLGLCGVGFWRLSRSEALGARFGLGLLVACTAAVGFAAWATLSAVQALDERLTESLDRQSLVLEVVVRDLPSLQERGWRFEAEVISAAWPANPDQPLSSFPPRGLIFWPKSDSANFPQSLVPGSRWRLQARVRQPAGTLNPAAFDLEAWMLERGLGFVASVQFSRYARLPQMVGLEQRFSDRVDQLRDTIRQRIHRALADSSAAGVIAALVVGDQRAIAASDWAVFRNTGVSHLMSISGLHVTMFAALAGLFGAGVWRLLCRWPLAAGLWIPVQSVAACCAIIGAFGYALLAGFAIPAQRTAWMVLVAGAAKALGVRANPWSVIAIALLVVLMGHPMAVLAPGFWLSFVAVAFLFSIASSTATQAGSSLIKRAQQVMLQAIRTQWAITLGLLPLTLLLFQQVSLVGPLANGLAIPVVSFLVTPMAMLGVMEEAIFDSTWLFAAAARTQEGLQSLLGFLARQSFASMDWPAPSWLGVGLATAGMVLVFGRLLPARWHGWRHLGWLGLLGLLGAAPPLPAEGQMQITLMDVGQGSGVLIRTRDHAMLYDVGPVMGSGDAGDRVILPTLRRYGVRHLDAIMVSHADQDHMGGLGSLLAAMPVRTLMAPEFESLANAIQSVRESRWADRVMETLPCRAGLSWKWNGVAFQLLYPNALQANMRQPKDRNHRSCVLRVADAYGGSILFTGDLPMRSEHQLVAEFVGLKDPEDEEAMGLAGAALASQVLMVPHHGSKTSLSEAFLRAVSPEFAAIQSGFRNRFGHPHPTVLQRLESLGLDRSRVLRTDREGAIEIRWQAGRLQTWNFWRDHRRYWHLQREMGSAEQTEE